MYAHEEIQIFFRVGGRGFKAVGFLGEMEQHIDGIEMLLRTEDRCSDGILDEKDREFLCECLNQLPVESQSYCLVVGQRNFKTSRFIPYLRFINGQWTLNWTLIDDLYSAEYLVVCRYE